MSSYHILQEINIFHNSSRGLINGEFLVIILMLFSQVLRKNIKCGHSLESLLMSTHNICFYGEIWKVIPKLSSNTLVQRVFCNKLFFSSKLYCTNIWTTSWHHQQNGMCTQRRLRSAWAFVQSDQSLPCPHEEGLVPYWPTECTAKTQINLPRLIWVFTGHTSILLVLSWGRIFFIFHHITYLKGTH